MDFVTCGINCLFHINNKMYCVDKKNLAVTKAKADNVLFVMRAN